MKGKNEVKTGMLKVQKIDFRLTNSKSDRPKKVKLIKLLKSTKG